MKMFLVTVVLTSSACSERVNSDEDDFDAIMLKACTSACPVVTECDPANELNADECVDGCLSWKPITEPNECASRFVTAAKCTQELTCDEYLQWVKREDLLQQDGTYPEGIPCEPEWSSLSSCSQDQPFEGGAS